MFEFAKLPFFNPEEKDFCISIFKYDLPTQDDGNGPIVLHESKIILLKVMFAQYIYVDVIAN